MLSPRKLIGSCLVVGSSETAPGMVSMAKSDLKFPSLVTERLYLRAPDMDDAEAFRVLLSIPEVIRYSNWPDAPTKPYGERVMRWMSKLHAGRNGCAWIIEDGASRTLIGAIRFNHFERKWKVGETGYELHPEFLGAGPNDRSAPCGRRLWSSGVRPQSHRGLDVARQRCV